MNKKKYLLYALSINSENIKLVEKYTFYRITPTYILVYCKENKKPAGAVLIKNDFLERLTKADENWLRLCNNKLIQTEVKKNKDRILDRLYVLVNQFEAELEHEQQKYNEGKEKT